MDKKSDRNDRHRHIEKRYIWEVLIDFSIAQFKWSNIARLLPVIFWHSSTLKFTRNCRIKKSNVKKNLFKNKNSIKKGKAFQPQNGHRKAIYLPWFNLEINTAGYYIFLSSSKCSELFRFTPLTGWISTPCRSKPSGKMYRWIINKDLVTWQRKLEHGLIGTDNKYHQQKVESRFSSSCGQE